MIEDIKTKYGLLSFVVARYRAKEPFRLDWQIVDPGLYEYELGIGPDDLTRSHILRLTASWGDHHYGQAITMREVWGSNINDILDLYVERTIENLGRYVARKSLELKPVLRVVA